MALVYIKVTDGYKAYSKPNSNVLKAYIESEFNVVVTGVTHTFKILPDMRVKSADRVYGMFMSDEDAVILRLSTNRVLSGYKVGLMIRVQQEYQTQLEKEQQRSCNGKVFSMPR